MRKLFLFTIILLLLISCSYFEKQAEKADPGQLTITGTPSQILDVLLHDLFKSPVLWPVMGGIGSIGRTFGAKGELYNEDEIIFSQSIDIHYGFNIPIIATADGKVLLIDNEPLGLGNYIIIAHSNDVHTLYGHMSKIIVEKGQTVRAGDIIGTMGNTGLSETPKLKYAIKEKGVLVDPFKYINKLGENLMIIRTHK